jgi:phage shock protein C
MEGTMNCSQCGKEIADYSNYCSQCGARQRSNPPKRLMLSNTDSKIAGVCGGLAEYFDVDPTIVRIIWAILSVVPGGFIGGIFAYLLAWIIIPRAPMFSGSAASAPTEHAAKTS